MFGVTLNNLKVKEKLLTNILDITIWQKLVKKYRAGLPMVYTLK